MASVSNNQFLPEFYFEHFSVKDMKYLLIYYTYQFRVILNIELAWAASE